VVVCNRGENYFQTSLVTVARKRVVWLFVLLQYGYRHDYQESRGYFGKVVTLAAYSLLVGTGGNGCSVFNRGNWHEHGRN